MSRHAIWLVALALGATAGVGRASVSSAQDAGVGRIEVRWERPPEGTLERGVLGVPRWTVLGVGAVAIAASAITLVAAVRRARRGAR